MKRYLEVGKVIGTKGLRGELKIQTWCDTPAFLKKFKCVYFDEGKNEFKVLSVRLKKASAIIALEGIDSCEQANRYIDKILYIDRNHIVLDEGQYFIQDLLGLKVFNDENQYYYGKITDVFKTGANDVYQITNDSGKSYLVPVIPDVVKSVDISHGVVKISPIKGIFDDEN